MNPTSLSILKQYWGYDQFRPLQEEVIHAVMLRQDTLALMPTGGGKSICFQVPAMLQEGICVVISPLIALMKDQVERLRKQDISAVAIYSGMTKREVDITLDNCIFGNIKFLYLSPERLYSDIVWERLRHMKVNLFAIDEAHCISEWGYDFRPSYLQLHRLRELHPEIPFLALTATATERVIVDIQEKLLFAKPNVLTKSFRRENLGYMVLPEEDKMGRMLRVIQKIGGSGIVYVRNRRETQEVSRYLMNQGISADFYHAGLDMLTRADKQERWASNAIRVIVATNAFGMGIDKSDVRFVIHLDIPDSLEAYYQEAGRAGRDGKKAFPVLLYNQEDRDRLWANLEASFPDVAFIQQVYHQLANYFQIAYGAGMATVLSFDVVDFAKKYQFGVLPTLSALKFLERDGWLSLSEAVFIPSRLKFEVDYQELYKFQVQSSKFDPLIKRILRSYGGAFDLFVPINEYEFAKALRVPYQEVVHMLQTMQQMELLTYMPKTDAPQLQFLRPRIDRKNLHVDTSFIRERRRIKEEQTKAIYHYLDTENCRSIALLTYFGESKSAPCGVCDLCLVRAHRGKVSTQVALQIKELLLDKPLPLKELIDQISIGSENAKLEAFRTLLDEEQIIVKENLYYWNVGF
ncbi:RecQ family ATP-dependent DNA helicase [Sphingobacterium sp. lm-10]|uniref:RecQ family ATP-dependent DNA helicase n=1 Tax=Sphingobacterium sp. lm-10 TaxID=2944904 RepID=UPI0020223339|nr:ATP-dependent DNA helicase RecQ [Sphingobacterium sp. lm-10]MCL7987983.1 RecQ family ATP-dependent DNA helicase [Sphingobacterium sp. lm-10]